jgi:hypothetical protein
MREAMLSSARHDPSRGESDNACSHSQAAFAGSPRNSAGSAAPGERALSADGVMSLADGSKFRPFAKRQCVAFGQEQIQDHDLRDNYAARHNAPLGTRAHYLQSYFFGELLILHSPSENIFDV